MNSHIPFENWTACYWAALPGKGQEGWLGLLSSVEGHLGFLFVGQAWDPFREQVQMGTDSG